MALGITTTKKKFRFDSPYLPVLTPTGITQVGKIMFHTDKYVTVTNATPYNWQPKNETKINNVKLRNVFFPSWTYGANVSQSGNGLQKGAGEETASGAVYSTLLGDNCSIEAKITALTTGGISLQAGVIGDYDIFSGNVEHAIVLTTDGFQGVGYIYELGLEKSAFKYSVGQKILIEKTGSVIRYYLIDSDKNMRLLRTTRSKLSETRAVAHIYTASVKLDTVYVWNGEETTIQIETIGVLENMQGWFDDFFHNSTADSIQMQDNNTLSTFTNSKKRVRSLSATRTAAPKAQRQGFVDFFNFHGTEIEFLFIDRARKDPNTNAPTEFWAKFVAPFGDKVRASCLSAHQAQIVETYRKDFIPLEYIDLDPPTIPQNNILTVNSSSQMTGSWNASTDLVGVTAYEVEISIAD